MNRPTPDQIRKMILTLMEVADSPQSHEDVARKLRWLTNPHRIAMNMDRLQREGVLRVISEGSVKRYALVSSSVIAVLEMA